MSIFGFGPLGGSPFGDDDFGQGPINVIPPTPTISGALPPAVNGTVNDDTSDIIRKHLPLAYQGKGWSAIIEALATGDRENRANARAAFDQLFLSSASGVYLDRRAGDRGIERPTNVGMTDDTFRQLALKESTGRLTYQSLLNILEVFYGTDAVTAHLTAAAPEPYALSDDWTLDLTDGTNTVFIPFLEEEFQNIATARAEEVVAAINRAFERADFPAWSQLVINPASGLSHVRIYSNAKGLGAQLTLVGGLAQNSLRLPTPTLSIDTGTAFNIIIPEQGLARFTIMGSALPLLLSVIEGDLVNIVCPNFNTLNRGSFIVTKVNIVWNAGVYDQYFEVRNPTAVAEGVLSTFSDGDVQFHRPTKATIYNNGGVPVVVAQSGLRNFDVSLPVTTVVVGRGEGTAAYLQPRNILRIRQIQLLNNGTANIETTTSHGLSVGNQLLFDNLVPDLIAPDTLLGNGTDLSGASQISFVDDLLSGFSARNLHASTVLANGGVLMVGGFNNPTYLGDSVIFKITGNVPVTSGESQGRNQYQYEWDAASSLPFAILSAEHRLNGLFGVLAGYALLTGGRGAASARATHKALLYSSGSNTWSDVPNGTLDARFGHVSIRTVDTLGDDVVYLIGGQTNTAVSQPTVQKFTSVAGGTISAVLAETNGRYRSAGDAVDKGIWVVAGGAKNGDLVRSDCLAYNNTTSSTIPVGKLCIARMDHAAISPVTGKLLVVGGLGHNLANETVDRVLGECEILDINTGRWLPAGKLKYPRKLAHVHLIDGKVWVLGGVDANGNMVSAIEIYDVKTSKWSVSGASKNLPENGVSSVVDSLILYHGGQHTSPVDDAELLVPGSDVLSPKKSLNQIVSVASIVSDTVFTVTYDQSQSGFFFDGFVEKFTAIPGIYKGPFIWDPTGAGTISSIETNLDMDVVAYAQYEAIEVVSADEFPDSPGWLVVGFGTSEEVTLVPYLGRISETKLMIDYGFKWPKAIGSGASVTFLSERQPFVPDETDLGAFYLTAASSGHIAAQKAVEESSAEGLVRTITIQYPGDKGLGGEEFPANNAAKLSDKVYVWGGDDPDAEIAAAEGGG